MKVTLKTKNLYWLTLLAAFLGTSVLTFSVGPISLFPFRIAIIILIIVYFISNGPRISLANINIKKSLFFHVFWLLYAVVSVAWAIDKVSAIKHVVFLSLNVTIIFFSVHYLRTIKDFWTLIHLWVALFLILIPVAIWETMTGNHLPSSGLNMVDEGYELYKFAPTTTFANQNDYATWIALTFPMLLSIFKFQQNKVIKIFILISILTTVVVLVFTTSRANYIAVTISTFFWLNFMTNLKTKIKYSVSIILLFVLILLLVPPEIYTYIEFLIEDFKGITKIGSGKDQGINIRENLIYNALYFTSITLSFGVGAGNVEYYMENFAIYPVNNITNVHNWFLELLANYGLIIWLSYLIFLVFIFKQLWKAHKQVKLQKERIVIESLLCPLIAFPISSISSSSLMAFNPIWVYFGLILAYINYKNMSIKR